MFSRIFSRTSYIQKWKYIALRSNRTKAAAFCGATLATMIGVSTISAEEKPKKTVVVVGPSGVGKGTLISMLLKEFPSNFQLSTSHTTRKPRPGEVNGVHYWFISREDFTQGIANGKFIEYNEYSGNLYGTSLESINFITRDGKVCVLDVNVDGAVAVKKTNLDALFYFILPPGADPLITLEQRLKGRGTDTAEQVQKRLNIAKIELAFLSENPKFFDHVIINDDLTVAYDDFKRPLKSEIL